MSITTRRLVGVAALLFAAQASAQITFYEGEGFHGRAFQADRPVTNFERYGFTDRVSSVIVDRGRWLVCEHANFEGRCVVLRHGNYDSLRAIGLDNHVSSVRPVDDTHAEVHGVEAPVPVAAPAYEYRRRPDEQLREVPVTSVRAVMGPPEQRCWVEKQVVSEPAPRNANVPGALIGGVVGGILGHQIGGGSGKALATVGGAAGGVVLGANVGRNEPVTSTRDIRRCENVANGTPQYWEVTYNYRGVEHHAQVSAPPGRTILVNREGEPRL
ncbi:MAG TPA: beta/gamma crystallin family protein [Caldimonas sp.]